MENKNLDRELKEQCFDYRLNLADKFNFADIDENDRFVALKNLNFFLDNFGSEPIEFDSADMIMTYKSFLNGDFFNLNSFKNCDDNQKLAAIMAMHAVHKDILKISKEDLKGWFNDEKNNLSPLLKATAFYSLVSVKEYSNWTLKDLEEIGIADWPEKIKYNLIKNLVCENRCKNNNLSDLKSSYSLKESRFFQNATPEIKCLLILKTGRYPDKIIEKLDIMNVYQLRVLLYRYNQNLITNENNEQLRKFINSLKYKFPMKYNSYSWQYVESESMSGYVKSESMSGNEKLMALLQLKDKDKNFISLDEFDKIVEQLDLKCSLVNYELLPGFFESWQKLNPYELTPELILKKNWPIEVKKVAFSSLPTFYKTERNRRIIFEAANIKSLIDKAEPKIHLFSLSSSEGTIYTNDEIYFNLDGIKTKMIDYMNMLLPEFERNSDNQKIQDLIKKINNINNRYMTDKSKAKKLLDEIYDTTKNLTLTHIDKLTEKLEKAIGDDGAKAEEFINYVLGKTNKVPDFIKMDRELNIFVDYCRNAFAKDRNFDKFFFELAIFVWKPFNGEFGLFWQSFSFAMGICFYFVVIPTLIAFPALILSIWLVIKPIQLSCKRMFSDYKEAKKIADQIKSVLEDGKNKDPNFRSKIDSLENKFNEIQNKIKNSNMIYSNGQQQQKLFYFLGLNHNCEIKKLEQEKQKLIDKKNELGNKLKKAKSEIEKLGPEIKEDPMNKSKINSMKYMMDIKESLLKEISDIDNNIKAIENKVQDLMGKIENDRENVNIEDMMDKNKNLITKEDKKENRISDLKSKSRSASVKTNTKPLTKIAVQENIARNKIIQKDSDENKIHRSNTVKNKIIKDI